MNTTHRNSPAFPCDWDYINSNREAANGMSLRDYFAAKAMQALLSTCSFEANKTPSELAFTTQIALEAFMFADAMLKARDA
jgi:hypothetical protein